MTAATVAVSSKRFLWTMTQQKRLLILKLRKDGMSYGEIAAAVALAKSEVFDAVKEMMRLPADITPEILETAEEDNKEKS